MPERGLASSCRAPDHAAMEKTAAFGHQDIRRIITGIMLAMFLGALDQTIVATALPTIGRELGDAESLSWIIAAYLLSSTAATPLYGKLSDIHGRRTMMLIAIGIFILGSLGCALAPDMLVLILARGLQGLGGGGLISLAQTIIADVVAPRERARYQGYIAGMFTVASVGGPVLGGLLSQHLHWSLIFWINLPMGLAAFVMTDRVLRRLPREPRGHRLDLPGAVLMVTAAVSLLLALTWGGVDYPWGSGPILGLIGLSLLLWAVFGWRITTAEQPFLPISILLNPVVRNATAAAFFTMGSLIGLCMFVPIYLEAMKGHSAGTSGLMLIAFVGTVPIGAMIAGRGMARLRHYKLPSLVGQAISVAMIGVLALWPDRLGDTAILALMAAAGIGIGCVLPVTTVSIQNAVPKDQMGTATGAMNFFRALGSAILVAGFSALFFAGLGEGAQGLSVEALHGSLGGQGAELGPVFTRVFGAAALCLLIGFGCMAGMEERPLKTSLEPTPAE